MRISLILSFLLLLFASPVWCANAITPGSVTVTATFESLSVRAPFTGDDNANATVAVQFRPTGTGTWRNAYTSYVDRRATIGGTSNPYYSEARGSIVGLVANTSYDVQVTWTDSDGVTGGQPAVVSVTTLSYNPPTGGSTITVTDNTTLSNALSTVNAGQTIHLNVGTYNAFTISRSGNSGAWIVIEGEANGSSVVSGVGVSQNISVSANYIILKNLTLSASDSNGIVLSSSVHHVFVQDNTLQNVSAQCASNPSGHYGDTGILVGNSTDNIYVLGNTIRSAALNSQSCTLNPPWDSPGTGIGWTDVTTLVAKGNTVIDGFRDAIASDSSWDLGVDVDLTGNTVRGYKDDGVESKGGNVNVRIWGNMILADNGSTCIAGNTNTETNRYGPMYIFRNTCRATMVGSGGATAYKLYPGVPMYLFHNSLDSSGASSPAWSTYRMDASAGPYVVKNNIAKSSGSMIEHGGSSSSVFDYNVSWVATGIDFAYMWNDTTNYSTLADFQSGTGQDTHSTSNDPLFLDTALHIGASSPAVDQGVPLANFNDADSAWPSRNAPDIGAFEYSP